MVTHLLNASSGFEDTRLKNTTLGLAQKFLKVEEKKFFQLRNQKVQLSSPTNFSIVTKLSPAAHICLRNFFERMNLELETTELLESRAQLALLTLSTDWKLNGWI